MDVRVFHGRYFEPRDEGRYARRAGWALPVNAAGIAMAASAMAAEGL